MLALIALFLGPTVAIASSLIAARVSKRNTVEGTNLGKREAQTHEFSALTEGFTESFRQMQLQIQELRGRVDTIEEERDTLAEKLHESTLERAELLQHLLAVEALVPDPPGAPVRPARWLK